MSDLVLDSCVVAKWFLAEIDSHQAIKVFHDVVSSGGRIVCLDLVFPEVGNAIWKGLTRGLISSTDAVKRMTDLDTTPLLVAPARPLIHSAFAIAEKYRRSLYDSLFVALSANLNLPGVTSDEPLYRAVHADHPNIILLRNW